MRGFRRPQLAPGLILAFGALSACENVAKPPQAASDVSTYDAIAAFELIPGRYPDTLSLPEALKNASPESVAATLRAASQSLRAFLGKEIPESAIHALATRRQALTELANLFVFDPRAAAVGFKGLNVAFQANELSDFAPPPAPSLPQTVDLEHLDLPVAPRIPAELSPIFLGLLRGYPNSDMPEAQAARHEALAEIFWRLSRNGIEGDEPFRVIYRNATHTSLDTLLDALVVTGHRVETSIDRRVANFTAFWAEGADGRAIPVAAPAFAITGYQDAREHDALVPVTHAEVVIKIVPSPERGANVAGEVVFFMGIGHGPRFFGRGLSRESYWVSPHEGHPLPAPESLRAAKLAGYTWQALAGAAQADRLWNGGYGALGVCNDSVGIVETAVRGFTDQYPLLLEKSALRPWIAAKLATLAPGSDAARAFAEIDAAVAALPLDTEENPTRRERALGSIVYEEGQEAFASVIEARKILSRVSH